MTTHALMPSTFTTDLSQHHQHNPHYRDSSMHPVHEQESAWYLPSFNESSSSSSSWMDHDSSSANYTHTPSTTTAAAASYSNPAWAASHHGSQTGDFDASSTPDWCTGVASTSTNAYLTPASSVVDFAQQRSYQSNLPSYLDHHEHTRSMTHSPSMRTCVSTSSETGSVYADGTPPPAPPAFYQHFADDVAQAAALSAIPEQSHSQSQPHQSKQSSKPANSRRPTAVSKAGARSSGSADSKELADKARERRSGHSAVERKYRENLNGKIEVLRQVLVEAHRNYDQAAMSCANSSSSSSSSSQHHHASDMSMTHTARHAATASKEGHPPPHSVITFAATIGSKKSDVLSTAIHYIKEAEQSRGVLLQQVAFLQNQIVKLEGVLCGSANDCNNNSSSGGSVSAPLASRAGGGSSSMTQHHDVKCRMMR